MKFKAGDSHKVLTKSLKLNLGDSKMYYAYLFKDGNSVMGADNKEVANPYGKQFKFDDKVYWPHMMLGQKFHAFQNKMVKLVYMDSSDAPGYPAMQLAPLANIQMKKLSTI